MNLVSPIDYMSPERIFNLHPFLVVWNPLSHRLVKSESGAGGGESHWPVSHLCVHSRAPSDPSIHRRRWVEDWWVRRTGRGEDPWVNVRWRGGDKSIMDCYRPECLLWPRCLGRLLTIGSASRHGACRALIRVDYLTTIVCDSDSGSMERLYILGPPCARNDAREHK